MRKANLFRKVLWFEKRNKYDIDFFHLLLPQRKINEHPRYIHGTFYSDKCQREVQYESGLELSFFKQLEQMKQVKFYWEQPIRIPYWSGRRKNTYTPDVAIYLQTNEIVLVEIKDLQTMLDYKVQAKAEALIEFCYQKGFGLLITDGKHTIDKIWKTKSNRKFENALRKAAEDHILSKRECQELMDEYQANQPELLKAILKHNLKYRPFPFKLRGGNKNEIFPQVFFNKRKYEDISAERFNKLFNKKQST